MKRANVGVIVMIAFLGVGLLPSSLAVVYARGTWTVLAAIGTAAMAVGLIVEGFRVSAALAESERRESGSKGAVASLEQRVQSLQDRVREISTTDDVTGVLNRRAFLARLDEVIQRDARLAKPMAFVLVDVEEFRKINNERGRVVGDQVLKRVALALQAATRGTDFVGRMGGDEFAVVLGECLDPRPAVDRVFVTLDGEKTEGRDGLPVRVSAGAVTIASPAAGVDISRLFQLAEGALGSVRGTGGGLCGRRELRPASETVRTV